MKMTVIYPLLKHIDLLIFSYLDGVSLSNCACVDNNWKATIEPDNKYMIMIWNSLYKKECLKFEIDSTIRDYFSLNHRNYVCPKSKWKMMTTLTIMLKNISTYNCLLLYVDPIRDCRDFCSDGSFSKPFKSVEDCLVMTNLLSYYHHSTSIKLKFDCNQCKDIYNCSHRLSNTRICDKRICFTHGEIGKHGLSTASYIHDMDIGDYFHFYGSSNICKEDNCFSVACEKHAESYFQNCEICSFGAYASQAMAGVGWDDNCNLCPSHVKTCCKIVDDENDEIVFEKYDDEGNAEEMDSKRICGFVCCSSCMEDHNCGEMDPSEYL